MAFKADHMSKFDQLDRFVKQQRSPSTPGAGANTRQRTKQMLALGQAKAEQTQSQMSSSAKGVKRIFAQSDVGSDTEQNSDLQMAAWIQSIEEDYEENKTEKEYDAAKLTKDLYGKKGVQAGAVASNSYFQEPLIEGGLRGNSRKAGDASPAVQETILNKMITVGGKLGMTDYEIAYALATVRYESGFNPDAAAKSTSARGLGQFVNKTGKSYGLNSDNQWDVDSQVQAVLEHTSDNFEMAKKKGYSNDYVYALHHDGPSLKYGGLKLGKTNVMPYVPKYLAVIENFRGND
tara:strand:+ start:334 stop:1206 length:873 start_codon:yes stop_codon:yes gene_type:complete